jgi:hypothetical protein
MEGKIMKNGLFCIIFFGAILGNIYADEPPLHMTEFISQNNQYKLILINTINESNNFIENWELVKMDTNELMYNFVCNQFSLSGLVVNISDNGEKIILVNYFLGVNWNNENTEIIKNKIVIRFYNMGIEINRYKLSDVFNNIRRGIPSVSHLQWTRYNYDRDSIIMENDQIIIKTLESYEYRFDIRNGNIINRRRI